MRKLAPPERLKHIESFDDLRGPGARAAVLDQKDGQP
jgi:hypothetical protein